jgi:DNA-binding transcriptional regulator/RsmH inhibitor MraZ
MFDTQGRIRISDKLLGYAEIKEEVVLLTGFTTIEIWAAEKAPSSDTVDISEYTSAVSDLGF